MTEEELKKRVDEIIAIARNDEVAHLTEDVLHRELLHKYLPNELWVEIVRLDNADFQRGCA